MTSSESTSKIFDTIKSWFPVVLTIGGLISGYILFKANTEHQFELIELRQLGYEGRLQTLADDLSRNKTEWQREVDRQLRVARETDIIMDMRIGNLEQRLNIPSRPTVSPTSSIRTRRREDVSGANDSSFEAPAPVASNSNP